MELPTGARAISPVLLRYSLRRYVFGCLASWDTRVMGNRFVCGIITRGDWRLLGLANRLLPAFFTFGWHLVAPVIPVIRHSMCVWR